MKRYLIFIPLSLILGYSFPTHAENLRSVTPTQEEVLNACVANQAERLPNPYSDVEPTHWAYKAVLSLYYCGAFRQATPPSLIQHLLESQHPSPPSETSEKLTKSDQQTD